MDEFDDATIAAIAYIMDHLAGLPADHGACEWFFWNVLEAYLDAALLIERRRAYFHRLYEPSVN
jgi:hypothetical protein